MIVNDNLITFKSHSQIRGFNFASSPVICRFCLHDTEDEDYRYNGYCCQKRATCWHSTNIMNYIKVEQSEVIEYQCLPSIPYVTSDQGHHLRIDIFYSDLVRSQKRKMEHASWTNN